MKAIILAGGKGTRLREITGDDLPKPMAEIAGKPILTYAIENLKENGITDIIMTLGYKAEKIMLHYKDGKELGVNIEYFVEKSPLGSGGALFYLKDKLDEDFVICPGDAIFNINFKEMIDFHKANNSLITLFTHPNLHPYDSDLIIKNRENIVTKMLFKNEERNCYYSNLVNAGVFIVSCEALDYFKEEKQVNLEHDFVNAKISTSRVFAYTSSEYIKDVGTPDRFRKTEREIKDGLVKSRNLINKQKAIFLDRDGTINKYKGFIRRVDDIELVHDCVDAIRKVNQSGYLAIVVSNQPVIARGDCSFDDVDEMFKKIETVLGEEGVYLDAIYYCPHHPHSGYEGEIKELKIVCDCRKPGLGLLKQAEEKFNLDLSKCYMIGDSNLDMKTAQNANMPAIRVKSDLIEDEVYDYGKSVETLSEAVDIILNKKYD